MATKMKASAIKALVIKALTTAGAKGLNAAGLEKKTGLAIADMKPVIGEMVMDEEVGQKAGIFTLLEADDEPEAAPEEEAAPANLTFSVEYKKGKKWLEIYSGSDEDEARDEYNAAVEEHGEENVRVQYAEFDEDDEIVGDWVDVEDPESDSWFEGPGDEDPDGEVDPENADTEPDEDADEEPALLFVVKVKRGKSKTFNPEYADHDQAAATKEYKKALKVNGEGNVILTQEEIVGGDEEEGYDTDNVVQLLPVPEDPEEEEGAADPDEDADEEPAPAKGKAGKATPAKGQAAKAPSIKYVPINQLDEDELQDRIDESLPVIEDLLKAGKQKAAEMLMRAVGKARKQLKGD